MKLEAIPIEQLRANPRNVRSHNRRNIDAIKASLARFGQQKPIVIGADGVVYAGNGTLEAAKELGWKKLSCVRTTLSEREAEAYGIADNRLNELSDWDVEMLQGVLADLDDVALEVTGFDDPELGELFAPAAEASGLSDSRTKRIGKQNAPTVRIVLRVEDVAEVERALAATGLMNRAQALLEICKAYEERQLDPVG